MKDNCKNFLALDIGASNGRAVLGHLHKGVLKTEEINRFANVPVRMKGTLYWNVLSLWANIVESMRICALKGYDRLDGIGIDTWGVDFGLIGEDGKLLGSPVHYRDDRTNGIENEILRHIDRETLYRLTGIPFMQISTLSQIAALRKNSGGKILKAARNLLMMPDLFRYFLCGCVGCDRTVASTSQLLNIRTDKWSQKILRTFRISPRILPPIVKPGTASGTLLSEVSGMTGIKPAPVIVVAGHDTSSAAAAVPSIDFDSAFLSCGSWAVMGVISSKPLNGKDAIDLGFVNELGFKSNLFVKNMMGLYLFEILHLALNKSCKKRVSYSQMVREASEANPFSCFLNINDPMFFAANDVEAAAEYFLRTTGQKVPKKRGAIMRALLEGLAFSCCQAMEALELILNRKFRRLFIVGGGTRNRLLCQFIANATGLEVVAGPLEAAAIGNISIQALAGGDLQEASNIRNLVASSFKLVSYKPEDAAAWEKYYSLYKEIVEKSSKKNLKREAK